MSANCMCNVNEPTSMKKGLTVYASELGQL